VELISRKDRVEWWGGVSQQEGQGRVVGGVNQQEGQGRVVGWS